MEKIKSFFGAHKVLFIVSFSAVTLLGVAALSAGVIFVAKNKDNIVNSISNGINKNSVDNNTVSESDSVGETSVDNSGELKQTPDNVSSVIDKIFKGIDYLAAQKSVGFDYFLADGDEFTYGANVKQDIQKGLILSEVTNDSVNAGPGAWECQSDCLVIKYSSVDCKYEVGKGYTFEEYDDFESSTIDDVVAEVCSTPPYNIKDVKNGFIEDGLSTENGNISTSFWELSLQPTETKVKNGKNYTVYTIAVDGLDIENDENLSSKDIVAEFDENGVLSRLEYPYGFYGFRKINFTEINKSYNISVK